MVNREKTGTRHLGAVALVGCLTAALAASVAAQEPLLDSVRADVLSRDTTRSEALARRRPSPGARELRVVISLTARRLWVLEDRDTLIEAAIGVARGDTLVRGNQRWEFTTPRGERRVRRKIDNPVWIPPDWHYAETARNYGLRLARLPPRGVRLRSGARLVIRDNVVGILLPNSGYAALPTDEHIVFDGTLFIPPVGTLNRRVTGDLGRYALDLGDGYMIHGTPNRASIGRASTHGCIRVGDEDLAWLYEYVPVGTRVVVR